MKFIISSLILSIIILFNLSCRNHDSLYENDRISIIIKKLHDQVTISYTNHLSEINDKDELIILRNSIYANHGMIFKSQYLNNYFLKCKWYKPLLINVDNKLTENDKYNIRIIQYAEKLLSLKSELNKKDISYTDQLNDTENLLIGIWHTVPIMPSGWAETYSFYPNRKVIERSSTMDCSTRLIHKIGNWRLKDNSLLISFISKSHIVGGRYIKSSGSCGTENELIDGKEVISKIDIIETFSISEIHYDKKWSKHTLFLEGKQLWKFDNNPDVYFITN